MGKFVIECPKCGHYTEAKTGFFAKKKIDCVCGNVIDIRTDKLSSRVCPHCGNNVVFDQSKGADAMCPVCKNPINTMALQNKTVEFSCKQCGVRHRAVKGASTYVCPVCDHVNDVAERLKTEEIRKDGLASIIKYEGDNETLVWKHPIEDFNYGSQLIVHESQEAIFYRDGQALDLFGAGRYTLETQQLPILEKLYKLPTDTEGTFHSEVYYVNLTTQMGIKWGTDTKVRLFDPMTGMHVELGASGEFNIRVVNSRKFLLKVVGTTGGFKQDQLMGLGGKSYFRSMVMTQVKSYLAAAIRENSINVLEIDERLLELSEALRDRINPRLAEYGLEMPEFFVNRVVTPDDDPNFRRMKEQFAQQYLDVREEQIKKNIAVATAERKAVEAQTEAQMKIIGAQGDAEALKIQKQAEAEAYRMQAAAEAEEMRMKGYTQKDVFQTEVQKSYAGALGQMGANGGGGGLGDVAGLGVTLGAMGGIIGMTKEAMAPMMNMSAEPAATGWDCSCGARNIQSKFCPDCGGKKPEPQTADTWDCPECGAKGITAKFCGECGCKKPAPPAAWDCPECGAKGITAKFCGECGCRKPEPPATWDCPNCGNKDITAKFCPECGHKKG
ncbi:MAG: SPFH domain-containing protein [Oscillospiraceae bacterium]|nr:SPFH domain-containing protein [Oscillospiraceae bacterium]